MAASASSADDLSTLHCESTSSAVASVSGTAEMQLPVDADDKYSATESDLVKASTEPARKIPSPALWRHTAELIQALAAALAQPLKHW
jgi:hypothetical protein